MSDSRYLRTTQRINIGVHLIVNIETCCLRFCWHFVRFSLLLLIVAYIMSTLTTPPTTGKHELTEQGLRVVIVTSVLTVLATLSVIARLWSRYVNSSRPGLEDWLVVAAMVFTWGYAAGNFICTTYFTL